MKIYTGNTMEKFCKTYYCDTSFLIGNEELIEKRISEVDEERRARIVRARFADTKADILAGGLIINAALKAACGIEDPKVYRNEYGKLYLEGRDDVFFNISHSGTMVICTVSDVECGVDIEDANAPHEIMGMARRFLSVLELDSVMLSDNPNRAFCRLWTLRESYVKMRGLGFNIGLSTLKCDFHRGRAKMIEGGKEQNDAFFRELHGIPGYQASVCLKEERENTVHKIEI